jgi:histidine ammonia-lyase
MGTLSARKCREIVRNSETVVAIELLCAAQAMDLFTNMRPGEGTCAAYRAIRDRVAHLEQDRILSHDIGAVLSLIRSGKLIQDVEAVVGELK